MHPITENLLRTLASSKKVFKPRLEPGYFAFTDLRNLGKLINVYEMLADDYSKKVFSQIIGMRLAATLIPHKIVREQYSPFSHDEWSRLCEQAEGMQGVKGDYALDRIETWLLRGYEYGQCKAEEGDMVIDGGAYTGNTGIYFSQCVGDKGTVYSFEPGPDSFKILCDNTHHIKNIIPIESGLGVKDMDAFFTEDSPGALIAESGKTKVRIRALDSVIQEKNINAVDFIKLDIEGNEEAALDGAVKTIQKHTPKMALCIYHKPQDLFSILEHVIAINPNYSFFIKHNSNWIWETVLFCMPSDTPIIYRDYSDQYECEIRLIGEMINLIESHSAHYISGGNYSTKALVKFLLRKSLRNPIINSVYQFYHSLR